MSTAGYIPNFTANETVYPFRLVRMDTSGPFQLLVANSASQIVLGVTDGSTRKFDAKEHAIAGGSVSLQNGRFVQVQTDGDVVAGDLLKPSADGRVLPIDPGERAFLQACDNAAINEIVWAFRVQSWEN
jgi:hypothetical protein